MHTSPGAAVADFDRLLTAARSGCREALGALLDAFRRLLLRRARRELPEDLQAKCAASDLVQDTLVEAQRDFMQFRGNTDEELRAWLDQILQHNFANVSRAFRECQKRHIQREVSLDDDQV